MAFNILLTNSTDIYGGGEYYVLELAKALQKRGHNVWVSCKPDNLLKSKCEDANIKVIPIDFPSRGALVKIIVQLKNIIHHYKIQILHSNSNYDRTAGAFAAKLAGITHVTNVHSFHSIQHNLTQWLRNNMCTDQFIVDGFCVKDILSNKDGISSSKISVVHLGVDPGSMQRDTMLRQHIRQEFGFSEYDVVIGNVARLVPMKGHEYLLQAFAKLSPSYPNVKLVLVGDGELHTSLLQTARSLNIQENIIFAGFRDNLQAFYSAFDIYAHASVEGGGETFPFAVLQALAQELPVVVTRVGDVPYMVDEESNGFVVAERNASALSDRLRLLIDNTSLRISMARNSREKLLQQFTIERMTDDIVRIYRAVVPSAAL